VRLPSVLVPYTGPTAEPGEQDIAVYLRPESNGVRVESTMLKVLRQSLAARDRTRLVYLANLPGDFIVSRGVVRDHYPTPETTTFRPPEPRKLPFFAPFPVSCRRCIQIPESAVWYG